VRRPHWPAPAPDAPMTVFIALRLLLPLAIGSAIGFGSVALLGVWALAVILPAVLIYCIREMRWIRRQQVEMAAELARFQELMRKAP
jgi:uncharacterized protein (DUF983 family)